MLGKVKAWIDSRELLIKGDKVVAACSGGPDSLALVHILHLLSIEYEFTLVVAHVDHMIRGQESVEDANFVEAFCKEYGLECFRTALDVPQYAVESGRSIEDAARHLRYNYFRQVAAQIGGAKIATGHHRDDQAETVLINLLRGTGSTGLRGIQAINGNIIRPLLSLSRAEIEEYCRLNGFEPRVDSTNLETEYLRNRVRLNLLPQLESQYNNGIREALCRTATIIGEEHDFIRCYAGQTWANVVCSKADGFIIDCNKLLAEHAAVQREIIRLTIEKKQGNLTGITFYHVERLIRLAKSPTVGGIVELPSSLIVKKGYHELLIGWEEIGVFEHIPPPGIAVKVPGITYITQMNKQLTAQVLPNKPRSQGRQTAIFDWQSLAPPLYVRTRLDGDRFAPIGLHGTKKLKDFFIDTKIPREMRDCIPIVCDSQNIIWVAGCRQSNAGKTTDRTTKFLQLTIQQMQ